MDHSLQDQPEGSHDAKHCALESSRPLVPLQAAQKRQSHDTGLGIQQQPTVFKSPRTNDVVKPVARHAYNPWLSDPTPSMRERHSAPGLEKEALSIELRGSKSAPDLRAPVLAAIRGLQDGTIQVDSRTRAKIAHAAKRVLESRELRRRTSQEAFKSRGLLTQPAPGREGNRHRGNLAQPAVAPSVKMEDEDIRPTVLEAPRGSAPARNLDLPRAEFKRPVGDEGTLQDDGLMQSSGEAKSGRISPFTVTTGVPRFLQEGLQTTHQSALRQARTKSTPLPLMQMSNSMTLEALPRSLDFETELQKAAEESKHA